jgi:hypothetical protein
MKKPDHIVADRTKLNWICERCLKRLSYQTGERLSTFENVKVTEFIEKHSNCTAEETDDES